VQPEGAFRGHPGPRRDGHPPALEEEVQVGVVVDCRQPGIVTAHRHGGAGALGASPAQHSESQDDSQNQADDGQRAQQAAVDRGGRCSA
jgi:hypothetical protein